MDKNPCNSEEVEVRKGPWTMEEDYILVNYIANHGEGVWNTVAKEAGLKRTGKSCRLRWLNYLRPDIRRGNITPEEELLIMELHAKWGNRWSRIAKHLPGRTDNEIKNYWRTRIQKHIKQADQAMSTNYSTTSGQQTSSATTNVVVEQLHAETSTHHHHHGVPCLLDHHHDHGMESTFSPVPSFNRNVDNSYDPMNLPVVEPNHESYWSMEDIWSIDLPNGD